MLDPQLTALLSVLDTLTDALRSLVDVPVTVFRGYSSILRWAADSVQSLFNTYGYWVVFFATLAENTLLLGLIIPGVLVIILAGLAAQDGAMSFGEATAIGIAGTCLGDTISYFMGRFGWTRLARKGSLYEFTERVREPILRRGPLFILIYHFAGYTRVVGPASAGMLRMPFARWAPADYLGASLWVTCYMAVGYGLGVAGLTLDSTNRWFRILEWGLLAAVALWGFFLIRAGQRMLLEHHTLTAHVDDDEASSEGVEGPVAGTRP